MSKLLTSLSNFQSEVNKNESVKKLTKDWNPRLIIQSSDSEEVYTLVIEESTIATITPGEHSANHEIRIEGDVEILQNVFMGKLNPAEAVLNGEMAVYGEQSDQIKLDAISLIIWGM